jgi:hypothetical protein
MGLKESAKRSGTRAFWIVTLGKKIFWGGCSWRLQASWRGRRLPPLNARSDARLHAESRILSNSWRAKFPAAGQGRATAGHNSGRDGSCPHRAGHIATDSLRWQSGDGRKASAGQRLFVNFGVRVHGGFADQEVLYLTETHENLVRAKRLSSNGRFLESKKMVGLTRRATAANATRCEYSPMQRTLTVSRCRAF